MKLFGEIAKVEEQSDGTIKVFGYASAPVRDAHGELITTDAMKNAIAGYMKFPAVREMHDATKAAGRGLEIGIDDDGKTAFVAHIVDPLAVTKVQAGVYPAFSIGGRVKKRDAKDKTIITALDLLEVSLVDRPSCPDATLDLWKADDATEDQPEPPAADVVEEIAKEAPEAEANPVVAEEIVKASTEAPEVVAEVTEAAQETLTVEKAAANADAILKRFTDALNAADERANAPAPRAIPECLVAGLDLRKGLYDVAGFAQVLMDVAYLVFSAENESQSEGDESPVPGKLREAWNALAAAFKAMSDEELAEMQARVNGVAVAKAAAIALGEVQPDLLLGVVEPLAKGLSLADPERDERMAKAECAIEKLEGEKALLLAKLGDVTGLIEKMEDRLVKLANEPLPGKTAGSVHVVEKAEDVSGRGASAATREFTQADVEKVVAAVAAMSEQDRALLLIKAAHTQGRTVSFPPSSRAV